MSDIPPATGFRFAVVTDNDHRGVIWVVSILCLIYTIMIFVIRTEAKRQNFGMDDWLATAATAFGIPQYIATFVATSHGLGRSFADVNASDAHVVGKSVLASEILFLLSLGLAKCSIILLCRRLFSSSMRSRLILCDVAMAVCGLWCIGSLLAVAIDCPPLALIGFQPSFCSNLVIRWKAIGALDCVTEFLMVILSTFVIWPLQMSVMRRVQALAAFFLRLIIVVFAVLHITSLSDSTTSHNRGVAITYPTVYLQVELLYALVSCAIPALNRWLRKFDTSMGTTWATAVGSQQRSTDQETKKNSRQSYRLSAVNNPQSRSKDRRHIPLNGPSLTPGNNQYTASCERQTNPYAGSSNSQEGHSNRSMSSEDMIIRKDVGWQVRYEDSTGPDDHSV